MSIPSPHLTEEALRKYRERVLPPLELLAVDDHLAGCADCRAQLARPETLAVAFRALCPAEPPVHVSEEVLADYVNGALPSAEALRVASHLEQCPECEEDAESLRIFRRQLAELPARSAAAPGEADPARASDGPGLRAMLTWLLQPAVLFPAQAVGVAAAMAVLFYQVQLRPLRSELGQRDAALQRAGQEVALLRRQNQELSARPDAAALAAAQARAEQLRQQLSGREKEYRARLAREEQLRKAAERRSEGEVLALESGGERILVDRDGKGYRVTETQPLPQMAVNALRDQEVEALLPEGFLQTAPIPRGGEKPFALLSPVATLVRDRRPVFRWDPLAGATHSAVVLIDETDGTQVESGKVTASSWTPPEPLEPGHRYQWVVRAFRGDDQLGVAPQPPAPVARFQVMDGPQVAALESELRSQGDSPLLRGLVLARAGVLLEAEAELEKLVAANPRSPVARNLLESVRAKRRGTPPE